MNSLTIGQLINTFITKEMVSSGGTPLVTVGTIDNSSQIVSLFDGFFVCRWDMLVKLAQQYGCYCYFDNMGVMQFRAARGFTVADSGSGIASSATFTDTSKSWTANQWSGFILLTPLGASPSFIIVSNTATVLTVQPYVITDSPLVLGYPTSGNYQIIDMVKARGTGTASGYIWTDSTAHWTPGQWVGMTLLDSVGSYTIQANTATTLSVMGHPTTGAYQIIMAFFTTGGMKNAAFSSREFNTYNIWNDVTVVGANGVTSNYRDLSTRVAFTTQTDTELAQPFDSRTDGTMYLNSVIGIPNSPGLVLMLSGIDPTYEENDMRKINGIYYYSGVSGNTLTGVANISAGGVAPFVELINDQDRPSYGAFYPAGNKVLFFDRIRVNTTQGFDRFINMGLTQVLIGTEVMKVAGLEPTAFVLADWGNGISTSGVMSDSSKSWNLGEWDGYWVVDCTNSWFQVTYSDATNLYYSGGAMASGIYMVIPPIRNNFLLVPNTNSRNIPFVAYTSADVQPSDTTIPMVNVGSFPASGFAKVFTNTASVEQIYYASRTEFALHGVQRGAMKTIAGYISSGSRITTISPVSIHPTGVRVQEYETFIDPSFNPIPEPGSSMAVNGDKQKIISMPTITTIENCEQMASRLLMNHRWGDSYLDVCAYLPMTYDNVSVGDTVQFTDNTLYLQGYTDRVCTKMLTQDLPNSSFYSEYHIGIPPKSPQQNLIDNLYSLIGQKNPNNQQYITGNTPIDVLTLQCGSPAVRVNAPGLDISQPNDMGFYNSNHVWIQKWNTSGPQFHPEPFWCYGVKIDSNGSFFAFKDTVLTNSATDLDNIAGNIYYNTTYGRLRYYDGTNGIDSNGPRWRDVDIWEQSYYVAGGITNYQLSIVRGLTPDSDINHMISLLLYDPAHTLGNFFSEVVVNGHLHATLDIKYDLGGTDRRWRFFYAYGIYGNKYYVYNGSGYTEGYTGNISFTYVDSVWSEGEYGIGSHSTTATINVVEGLIIGWS